MSGEFGIISSINKSGGAVYQHSPPRPTTLEVADVASVRQIPQPSQNDIERFWSFVDRSGGPDTCWLWLRAQDGDGYGLFHFANKMWRAHRVAYFIATGNDPLDLMVLHECDAPPCCNPAHLSKGTHTDNVHDMWRKGRGPSGDLNGSRKHPERLVGGDQHWTHLRSEDVDRGENHVRAKVTEADVRDMRRRFANGETMKGLAREYGISDMQVRRIVRLESWKHVA